MPLREAPSAIAANGSMNMTHNRQPACHCSFRLTGFGQPLAESRAEVPEPVGTQVLLRVLACGVCHSDLHMADGYFTLGGGKRMDLSRGIALPRTLGHEVSGEVVALGPQATDIAVGERRVLFPWVGCGQCALCAAGQEHLCAQPRHHGTTADGGFSNFVLVPHPRYLLPFGDLNEGYAATLACSGLTAYSALRKAGPLTPADPLLIIGAGGVGSAAVSIARALYGVAPIVADIDAGKRQGALQAGAAEAVDPADPEVRKRLQKQTGGVAAVIDFVGAQSTAEFGVSLLRKGGRLVMVGLFGGALEIALPTLPLRSISILGSYVGSLQEMNALLTLAREGRLAPMQIETRPLSRIQHTFDDLRAGRIQGRAVLVPTADAAV